MNGLGQVLVAAHPVAVAPDVDDVATVQQPVRQSSRHDFVVQDVPPVPDFRTSITVGPPVARRPPHRSGRAR